MADAHSRRALALDAITSVLGGGRARDVESETVDFKEERGTYHAASKTRVPIDPHHEPAAVAISEEVACLSNSDQGGVLVVGVNDKAAGRAAFVDTHLDTVWLRRRIHALTSPSLSVDVIEERYEAGRRPT